MGNICDILQYLLKNGRLLPITQAVISYNISIQFVASGMLTVNSCWISTA